ncbi:MBL fold metallo-hydrolase [Bailinhaonella thermotolerans]|uniref:MBL fold metallo-hydrolase n=1 Tax=Bailinhaonella thermotolerans TaxID=1070861 RepID=A0A3A4BR81_9ACTN|nr:MBL fold metallo-hydrolase [Bailinhaonella thermotolerans]RJL33646.1 MBL fold metallo-hydrolase [Bailinhaonella thermotolerans]
MTARIERVVTSGVVTHDDVEYKVDNNTWIIGDDDEVIVIDPARDAEKIMEQVGEREVLAVICTHGYPDHVGAAIEIVMRDEAVVALHPRDKALWRETWPETQPDIEVEPGGQFAVGDVILEVVHTPGASPGGISLTCDELGVVFTGKTLQADGPGKVYDTYPDLPTQLTSIGQHLISLPPDTRVLPAHGEETTVEEQEPHFDDWLSGRLTTTPASEEAADSAESGDADDTDSDTDVDKSGKPDKSEGV